jgi:peptidyl-prolyl cis-trans isomerase C
MRSERTQIVRVRPGGATGPVCLFLTVACAAFLADCKRDHGPKGELAFGGGSSAGVAVAKIGSLTLSAADIAQHLAGQTEASRLALADTAARRHFVDSVVRFELLAAAAERRGYAKDPQVIRGMKQQMIARMLEDDVAKHPEAEISADKIERYYDEHRDEFQKPAAVSIRQIVVKDKATAETIASQARAARRPDFTADQKAFEDIGLRYRSFDNPHREQVSPFFEENGAPWPRDVARAAFAMTELGAVVGPIEAENEHYVLKLAGQRPAISRTLGQVREQIRQRLLLEFRNQRMEAFVSELQKRTPVQIDEGAIEKMGPK